MFRVAACQPSDRRVTSPAAEILVRADLSHGGGGRFDRDVALMLLSAGTTLGPYEVVAPLGSGGMGEVYRARDTRLDRTVAIKILPADVAADPQRRERFRREARAMSRLTHPHIC
jgi:serine/threonine protein kinase